MKSSMKELRVLAGVEDWDRSAARGRTEGTDEKTPKGEEKPKEKDKEHRTGIVVSGLRGTL